MIEESVGVVTVKFKLLLAIPAILTTTFPVVAPAGTGTVTVPGDQPVGLPAIPLKVTVLLPCEVPRFVPAIVIEDPALPDDGDKLVKTGGKFKLVPALGTPRTVTTTGPLAAP